MGQTWDAGEMLHNWLRQRTTMVQIEHRAKGDALKALKKRFRLKADKVQCQEIRKAPPPRFPRMETIREAVEAGRPDLE